jgi:hypothetical protein
MLCMHAAGCDWVPPECGMMSKVVVSTTKHGLHYNYPPKLCLLFHTIPCSQLNKQLRYTMTQPHAQNQARPPHAHPFAIVPLLFLLLSHCLAARHRTYAPQSANGLQWLASPTSQSKMLSVQTSCNWLYCATLTYNKLHMHLTTLQQHVIICCSF